MPAACLESSQTKMKSTKTTVIIKAFMFQNQNDDTLDYISNTPKISRMKGEIHRQLRISSMTSMAM